MYVSLILMIVKPTHEIFLVPMQRFQTLQMRESPSPERMFHRTATVEFAEQSAPRHRPDLLSVRESEHRTCLTWSESSITIDYITIRV